MKLPWYAPRPHWGLVAAALGLAVGAALLQARGAKREKNEELRSSRRQKRWEQQHKDRVRQQQELAAAYAKFAGTRRYWARKVGEAVLFQPPGTPDDDRMPAVVVQAQDFALLIETDDGQRSLLPYEGLKSTLVGPEVPEAV